MFNINKMTASHNFKFPTICQILTLGSKNLIDTQDFIKDIVTTHNTLACLKFSQKLTPCPFSDLFPSYLRAVCPDRKMMNWNYQMQEYTYFVKESGFEGSKFSSQIWQEYKSFHSITRYQYYFYKLWQIDNKTVQQFQTLFHEKQIFDFNNS